MTFRGKNKFSALGRELSVNRTSVQAAVELPNLYKVNTDTNSASNIKVDPKDVYMVFGNAYSPKRAEEKMSVDTEMNTFNLSDESRPNYTTNEPVNDSGDITQATPAQPAPGGQVGATLPGDEVATINHRRMNSLPANNDVTRVPIENSRDDNRESAERSGRCTPDSHHSKNSRGGDNIRGNWWPIFCRDTTPNKSDGQVIVERRFGTESPKDPVPTFKPLDVNAYQQRKNLAHGMMDLALLTANSNQLRNAIEASEHPYYYPSVTFISLSIIVQIVVGVLLIVHSRYDVTSKTEIHKAIKVNNITVAGVFLVTVINVFITSFSVAPTRAMINDVRQTN